MNVWRREAMRLLPEYKAEIESADSLWALWFDIGMWFDEAYASKSEDLLRRIYEYLWWSLDQPQQAKAEDDPITAACCCLVEHIPDNPKSRSDMKRWWSRTMLMNYRNILSYHIGDDGFVKLLYELYPEPRKKK